MWACCSVGRWDWTELMLGNVIYVPTFLSLGLPEALVLVWGKKLILDASGKKNSYNLYEDKSQLYFHNYYHILLLRQLNMFFFSLNLKIQYNNSNKSMHLGNIFNIIKMIDTQVNIS